jgi:integral membrane protein
VEKVIGPLHGVLYIVYLATVVNMLIVYRLGFWYFVGMVVAGWCPFVSFVVERLVSRRLAGPAGGYTAPPTFESDLEP